MRLLQVQVLFYSKKRSSLPINGIPYRPHFIVDGNYLGVEFVESDIEQFDKTGSAVVKLLYDGLADYSPLKVGACFDIAEGATIVGKGVVC